MIQCCTLETVVTQRLLRKKMKRRDPMARVVHFEIAADEPQRAIDFYREVFNWKVQKWEGPQDYWLLITGDGQGIDGGLMKRSAEFPPTTNSIDVPSVDDFAQKILAHGGR